VPAVFFYPPAGPMPKQTATRRQRIEPRRAAAGVDRYSCPHPHPRGEPAPSTSYSGTAPADRWVGLVAVATIVVQASHRQRLRQPRPQPAPAKGAGNPRGNSVRQAQDRQVKDLSSECFTRRTAQARHARSPEIGDPDIDLALRYAEPSRRFGSGPSVHENALHNQRSPRHCHRAMLDVSGLHAPLTRAALIHSGAITRRRR